LSFVGLEARYRLGETAGIPGQWGRFMSQYWRIEAPQDPIPWGVADAASEEGAFTYMTAARVGAGAAPPAGFVRRQIPARTYLVFVHQGHASRIGDTVAAIWNDWLPELTPELGLELLDAPSLERHGDDFDPGTGQGGVEIWVPVQA
jgi:AraC family transcriptional regulator